ncbi:zinc finger CCCH domain-containing protein 2-like [Humulus lupulus]|uniref:zinc finger CCCH domain-containing protein 2-like n=1 Tax=Humulus lupulus TaxID=3486 RepID=UPI002B401FAD|nr:zinc finger CCCH domain-containing protein 2-like [Humulus lupulus]
MSTGVCSDQQKLHHLLLRDINIPPRKLVGRRHQELAADMFSGGSPRFSPGHDESTLFQKFLPYNNSGEGESDDDGGSDPYSSDHFRMYEFKVRRCTRSRSHDWTDCPFAHPGEKARRRDPRRHHYSGMVCPDYRRGGCGRGDSCEFAHGVFECWLHPARYRTEACKDGKNCNRKVCFFAHSPRQLRILPLHSNGSPPEMASPVTSKKKSKYPTSLNSPSSNHCCVFCSCHNSTTSSPTSTLLGISHFSPPMSPEKFSPISGYNKEHYAAAASAGGHYSGPGISYKEALTDLMSSIESMNFNEAASPVSPISVAGGDRSHPWVDIFPFNTADDQQQFILSPSTPSYPSGSENFFGSGSSPWSSKRYNDIVNENNSNKLKLNEVNNGGSGSDPDLGWVNDLLM